MYYYYVTANKCQHSQHFLGLAFEAAFADWHARDPLQSNTAGI
jgi:hypothetical protein